jgi:hypothetical protein
MGARTALAKTTARKSVERQAAAIESLMGRMMLSSGLTQHSLDGKQRDAPVVPGF